MEQHLEFCYRFSCVSPDWTLLLCWELDWIFGHTIGESVRGYASKRPRQADVCKRISLEETFHHYTTKKLLWRFHMERKHASPVGHWNWPVEVTHKHGLRCGEMTFVGGQMDLDSNGNVQNPGNLWIQLDKVVHHIDTVLRDLGGDLDDVVKIVMHKIANRAK